MNLDELHTCLVEEGYGPLIFERGPWGLAVGDFRIVQRDGSFTLCWSERGEVYETLLVTTDEQAACDAFRAEVSQFSLHLAASEDRATIERISAALTAAGIAATRNDIPDFDGPGDVRYRIFVDGRDLARGHEIVASLDGAL
jgi:hypothetical protein